jgi:hypothetical protein
MLLQEASALSYAPSYSKAPDKAPGGQDSDFQRPQKPLSGTQDAGGWAGLGEEEDGVSTTAAVSNTGISSSFLVSINTGGASGYGAIDSKSKKIAIPTVSGGVGGNATTY